MKHLQTLSITIICNSEKIRPGQKHALVLADVKELSTFIKNHGENAYRAKQIYDWTAKKFVSDPEDMTNLSAKIKDLLREEYSCGCVRMDREETAPDGSRKLLLRLEDDETIECAILGALDGRNTFCLSTQVGCPVRCAFCASGSGGFVRNLTAGEIVEQYLLCCRLIGKAPDNVVIMGIGEPMLNLENLIRALETICNPEGIALAARRVTISTSGWTPGIKALAQHGRQDLRFARKRIRSPAKSA